MSTNAKLDVLYGKRPDGNGWIEIGEARHPENRARGVLMYNVNSARYWLVAAGSVMSVPPHWAAAEAERLNYVTTTPGIRLVPALATSVASESGLLHTGHEADVGANDDRSPSTTLPPEPPMCDEGKAILADFFSGDDERARAAIERSAARANHAE